MKQKMSILFSALALGACAGVGYEPATPEFQRAIASALGHKKARPIPAVAKRSMETCDRRIGRMCSIELKI